MLWAEKLNYTALILTSSVNSMFSLILKQWWMSSQLNWSILVLLGIFFCPEILQYVQCFLLSYAIWGFPNAKLIGSCLHTAGVKTFYTNVAGKKRNWSKTNNFMAFSLFVLANIKWGLQLKLCFGKTRLPVLYPDLIFVSDIVLKFFSCLGQVIWPLFKKKKVPFGLALFIWRLAWKKGAFFSGWVQMLKLHLLYLIKRGSKGELWCLKLQVPILIHNLEYL